MSTTTTVQQLKEKYSLEAVHYSEYGAYHISPMNKQVHRFGVPALFYATVGIAFSFAFKLFSFYTSTGTLVMLVNPMLLYYPFILRLCQKGDPPAVLLTCAWCAFSALVAKTTVLILGFKLSLFFFVLISLGGWSSQVYAHRTFDQNAPALLDSFLPSLVDANYFITLEALFEFLNYKPKFAAECHSCATERKAAGIRAYQE